MNFLALQKDHILALEVEKKRVDLNNFSTQCMFKDPKNCT